MKKIRCDFTKACLIFATFTESLYKNVGYFLKIFKRFHMFIKELYACLYHCYMFKALSLLVY